MGKVQYYQFPPFPAELPAAAIVPTQNPAEGNKNRRTTVETIRATELHRAAGDFGTFDEKTEPVDADILLAEDSADAGAKKRAQLGRLTRKKPDVLDDDGVRVDFPQIYTKYANGPDSGFDVYPTDDGTAGGTALFNQILAVSLTGMGEPMSASVSGISGDFKTVTIKHSDTGQTRNIWVTIIGIQNPDITAGILTTETGDPLETEGGDPLEI